MNKLIDVFHMDMFDLQLMSEAMKNISIEVSMFIVQRGIDIFIIIWPVGDD